MTELKLQCISKTQLYPEEQRYFKATIQEVKTILDFCKKDKLSFTPRQFYDWFPRPEIVQFDANTFAAIAIGDDYICSKQLTKDEVKQIAEDAIDTLSRLGQSKEELEMVELFEKMFPEEKEK